MVPWEEHVIFVFTCSWLRDWRISARVFIGHCLEDLPLYSARPREWNITWSPCLWSGRPMLWTESYNCTMKSCEIPLPEATSWFICKYLKTTLNSIFIKQHPLLISTDIKPICTVMHRSIFFTLVLRNIIQALHPEIYALLLSPEIHALLLSSEIHTLLLNSEIYTLLLSSEIQTLLLY